MTNGRRHRSTTTVCNTTALICFIFFCNLLVPSTTIVSAWTKDLGKRRSWFGWQRSGAVPIKTATNQTNVSTNFTPPIWQQRLPPPLSIRKTLRRINIPLTSQAHVTVYLLGTSHVSNDSSADVQVLLNETIPNVVFLELCEQRIPMLSSKETVDEHGPGETAQQPDGFPENVTFWQKVQQIQQASGMSKGNAIGTVLLSQVQDDYAASLGVELGGEFRVAWQYCLKNRPVCILGDRPVRVTLLRAWESLSWWGKMKCLVGLVWSSLQKPDPQELRDWLKSILEGDSDLLTESMAELREAFPSLERVILKERDAYLAAKIYQTCRYLPRNRNTTMAAIVGAGHVDGICSWLTDGNGQQPEEILRGIIKTKKAIPEETERLIHEVSQLPCRPDVVP